MSIVWLRYNEVIMGMTRCLKRWFGHVFFANRINDDEIADTPQLQRKGNNVPTLLFYFAF